MKIKLLFLLLGLLPLVASCGGSDVAPALLSLSITPDNVIMAEGATQQFTATGHFSDGRDRNVTGSVRWESVNSSITAIGAATGVATAVSPGLTSVIARYPGSSIYDTTTVFVGGALPLANVATPLTAIARFGDPAGVTTDGTYLYVADRLDHAIYRVNLATNAVTTFAGSPGVRGYLDAFGTAARFNDPISLTTDGGYLYVAEYGNHTIRMIDLITAEVTTLAGRPGVRGSSDGLGTAARFDSPSGLATDGLALFVADSGNNTIRIIDIGAGEVFTLAGSPGVAGSTDGTGLSARFSFPSGLTYDGAYLYVADYGNHTIREIEVATGIVATVAGRAGTPGFANGTGSAARFSGPTGITTDGVYLYVAEEGNSAIRRVGISSAAVISTDYGLAQPVDITTDGFSLYVTDSVNGRAVAID